MEETRATKPFLIKRQTRLTNGSASNSSQRRLLLKYLSSIARSVHPGINCFRQTLIMPTSRRQFLLQSAASLVARAEAEAPWEVPQFRCDNPKLQKAYDAAVSGLKSNVQNVYRFPRPVLLEGATYAGVWLECGPLEGLVYAPLSPETALANHEVFFDLQ